MNEILKTTLVGLFFGTFGTTIGGIIGIKFKNPSNKFLSFILSFTAAFFLIFSSDLLKGKNYFVSLFKVSLLSYFASLPLSIYYFGYTNLLGTILNLVFVPLVSFVVFPLTLLTFIISKFYYN